MKKLNNFVMLMSWTDIVNYDNVRNVQPHSLTDKQPTKKTWHS